MVKFEKCSKVGHPLSLPIVMLSFQQNLNIKIINTSCHCLMKGKPVIFHNFGNYPTTIVIVKSHPYFILYISSIPQK